MIHSSGYEILRDKALHLVAIATRFGFLVEDYTHIDYTPPPTEISYWVRLLGVTIRFGDVTHIGSQKEDAPYFIAAAEAHSKKWESKIRVSGDAGPEDSRKIPEKLKSLLKSGVISPEEFAEKKTKILDDL